MQPSLFAVTQWTVTQLTNHIRDRLETDVELQDLWVQGEISNLSRPASGHVYFTLKDPGASLRCVVWKSTVSRLGSPLQEGQAVVLHGKIGVYEAQGSYQLYVDQARPAGEGELYQEFLRLKAALEAEGLFAPATKQQPPPQPGRIGIVTSPTGAALRDVLNTLRRRLPLAEVILAPSQVQGAEAPPQLVEALDSLHRFHPQPEVILLVRGGGSIEDLWAFNDERVVRAVAASTIPVICGVGHETDFTLCDFAADVRAPTPTAAAELATPTTVTELRQVVGEMHGGLADLILGMLDGHRSDLESVIQALRFQSPERRINTDRQRVDDLGHRMQMSTAHLFSLFRTDLQGWQERLAALNPTEILARGYAIVTRRADGALVRTVKEARDGISVRVSDGAFDAQVVEGSQRK